jgi:hypothetical protein
MNSNTQNRIGGSSLPCDFDETLRLIARLSPPEGLEERVKAGLCAAPASGKARILAWPNLRLETAWMRSAAAAAIVAVVVGGSWGIYSHVQLNQPSRAIATPPRVSAQGGFSSAGAMRTPQTLNGPVAPPAEIHSATAAPLVAKPEAEPTLKTPVKKAPIKSATADKAAAPPAAAREMQGTPRN